MNPTIDAVNERLPPGKLFTLGLQHVLVMSLQPLIDSGILLASLTAVGLNVLFNGAGSAGESDARDAALAAEGSH